MYSFAVEMMFLKLSPDRRITFTVQETYNILNKKLYFRFYHGYFIKTLFLIFFSNLNW